MSLEKKRRNLIVRKWLAEIFSITMGCSIMAVGTSLFLLPNQLSSGGFSGIATIAYYLFHFPMGITIILLNIPLFILTFIRVGKEVTIKGILGTVILSVLIDMFDQFQPLTDNPLLACIYGGICIGIGMAIVLKVNASTGGTDLLSYIIRSYVPTFRTSNLIVIIDTVIVLSNVIVFKEIEIGLYSAIAIYIMGKMIDIVFEGVNFTKSMFIVSNHYREIAQEIGEKLKRGSTAILAKGTYTKEKRMMLWCVGSRNEVLRMKEIAMHIDPQSFIVISNAREAWGKGFRRE